MKLPSRIDNRELFLNSYHPSFVHTSLGKLISVCHFKVILKTWRRLPT